MGKMRTQELVDAPTGTGLGPIRSLDPTHDEIVVQIDISDTATVKILGRVCSRREFIELKEVTSSSIVPIAAVDQVRVNVTANTGSVEGTVGSR